MRLKTVAGTTDWRSERMRVVFMGTPDFAAESLKAVLDAGYEVAGVFT